MRHIKLKANNSKGYKILNYFDFYVSPDMSFISGVTDVDNSITTGDNLVIRDNNTGSDMRIIINTRTVLRQGVVKYKEIIPIHSLSNAESDKTVRYIEYNGDIVYEYIYNGVQGFLVNNSFYESFDNISDLTINGESYIEDMKVSIGGIDYIVEFEYDGTKYTTPTIKETRYSEPVDKINGFPYKICDYTPSKWKRVIKFYSEIQNKHNLSVEKVSIGGYYPFIVYNDMKYYVDEIYFLSKNGGYDLTDDELHGYGVIIDGQVYRPVLFANENGVDDPSTFIITMDWLMTKPSINIDVNGRFIPIQYELRENKDGNKIMIFLSNDFENVYNGQKMYLESNGVHTQKVLFNENGEPYITDGTNIYMVENNGYDTITINDRVYRLNYIDTYLSHAYVTLYEGEDVIFKIEDCEGVKKAKYLYKIIQKEEDGRIVYANDDVGYEISENSGVTIDNVPYKVYFSEFNGEYSYYADINSTKKIALNVDEVIGSSLLVCSIDFWIQGMYDTDENNRYYTDEATEDIKDGILYGNSQYSLFSLGNDILKYPEINPQMGYDIAVISETPISLKKAFGILNNITIYKEKEYADVKVLLGNKNSNNYTGEDIVNNYLSNSIAENNINKVVDMEKDVYYPSYKKNIGIDDFNLSSELRFNLHFRTRYPDTWKIISDETELVSISGDTSGEIHSVIEHINSENSNWFITDYYPYKKYFESSATTVSACTECGHIVNDRDFYKGIEPEYNENWNRYSGGGFIRNSSVNRVLAGRGFGEIERGGTSQREFETNDLSEWKCPVCGNETMETIDINTYDISKRFQNLSDLIGFLGFTDNDVDYRSQKIAKSFLRLSYFSTPDPKTQVLLSTSTIFLDENALAQKRYRYVHLNQNDKYAYEYVSYENDENSHLDITVDSEVKDDYNFSDELRMGSTIVVKDDFLTETSSEGFRLYLFKEYAKGRREVTIYLKVDFCHAGYGLTIPFIIPTKKENGVATPLYLGNSEDLEKLKNGVTANDLYDNLFIPINIRYDEKLKKYIYYLPDNLVENVYTGTNDDIMEFNLFELKFKNESF